MTASIQRPKWAKKPPSPAQTATKNFTAQNSAESKTGTNSFTFKFINLKNRDLGHKDVCGYCDTSEQTDQTQSDAFSQSQMSKSGFSS